MRHKRHAVTVILLVALAAGTTLLLYPAAADRWNSRTMSMAVASYDETAGGLSDEDCGAILEEAREYNRRLCESGGASAGEGYYEILDITGTGIMGYVTIDRLGIELPIYHGTDADVLAAGAGHLEGSSFPVGGENTHSVISAHRGLPSAMLFTHLDEMEEGDIFTITVLNESFTYMVDRINVVLPTEYEELGIVPGGDYCTLMTCTPYGINTHRLLVRGERTDGGADIRLAAGASRINPLLVAPFIAAPMMALFEICLFIRRKMKTLSQ